MNANVTTVPGHPHSEAAEIHAQWIDLVGGVQVGVVGERAPVAGVGRGEAQIL